MWPYNKQIVIRDPDIKVNLSIPDLSNFNPESSGTPFFAPFFARTLFCAVFAIPEKQKKGHSRISEHKMTKMSDFFYLGHFSTKG